MIHPDPEAARNCRILLDGIFKRSSLNKGCEALGRRLGLHPKTVMMISHGRHCGKDTADKLRRLVEDPNSVKPPRVRRDKLRVYTPVSSENERKRINRVPPAKRRDALLAAHFEEE